MPIPQEKEIRRVILEFFKDGHLHDYSAQDFLRIAAEYFGEDLNDMSSIDKSILKSRVEDAKKYLKRHNLIANPSLKVHIITKTGVEILANTTGVIDDEMLKNLSAKPPQLAEDILLKEPRQEAEPEQPTSEHGDQEQDQESGTAAEQEFDYEPEEQELEEQELEEQEQEPVQEDEIMTSELPDNINLSDPEQVQEEQEPVQDDELLTQELQDNINLSAPEQAQEEQEPVQEQELLTQDLPDNINFSDSEQAQEEQEPVQEQELLMQDLPDNINFSDSEPEQGQEPVQDDELLTQDLPDNLNFSDSEQAQGQDPVQEQELLTRDLPDNINFSDSEQAQELEPVQEDELLTQDLPDNINLSDQEQEPEEQEPVQKHELPTQDLPDNINMSDSESEPEDELIPEPEELPEEENILDYKYTTHEITEGEDIMPAEDFSPEDYPDEAVIQSQSIEDVLERYNSELADKVLMRVAGISSETFEVIVIDLLSKMGYRAFQNAKYTNDEADNGMIQGVILDNKETVPIYIHAKKLSPGRTVGRADIQDFVEALADKGGKGIFATTAEFSDNAVVYAQDERIMLIDGAKLAGLMIAHNFCVNVEKVFEVKEIDEESFSDYER